MEIYGIMILWFILSLLVFIQYAPAAKSIPFKDKIVFIIICLIGGPIFSATTILETILNCILPDGWSDDND